MTRTSLADVAPRFVAMAQEIEMAVVATVGRGGRPRTRVMQPVWAWDGTSLVGWVSTTSTDPKMDDLQATPQLSLTYWNPDQDTCTADCEVELVTDPAAKAAAWDRFKTTPGGFDPAIHPDWDDPSHPTFGVLRLTPTRLRVMPGTLMTKGEGEVMRWSRRSPA